MRLISGGAPLHEHAWVAHELDLERKSWPQEGDKRRCVECGDVQIRRSTPFGNVWAPRDYASDVLEMRPV